MRGPQEPEPTEPTEPGAPEGPEKPQRDDPFALMRSSTLARLHERRIVFLRGALEGDRADDVCAQLLALDADGDGRVTLFIDSPGGDTFGMFAIHDTVQLMAAPVDTVCVGLAASAGAFLLATGTGRRAAAPNARIMLHQPLGGGRGTASDIAILAREFVSLRERMQEILAQRTGQTVERIAADLQRDFWMSAEEARVYGVVDEVATRLT